MSEMVGKAKGIVELIAVVHPPCACGLPWSAHRNDTCIGYVPSKPSVNHGTIYFRSNDWLANALFMGEHFFQRLRVARMRRL